MLSAGTHEFVVTPTAPRDEEAGRGSHESSASAGANQGVDVAQTPAERARLHSIAVAHYDFVWRSLRRLGLPPAAADDATQQVFLVAARRLNEINDGAEKAFLYRSASLIALEMRRKYGRRREHANDDAVAAAPDDAPGPEEIANRNQARVLLDEALNALDDDVREVFVLFEIDAMPIAEIAALLQIPQGTCASRLRRGREQFQDAAKRIRARQRNAPLGRTP